MELSSLIDPPNAIPDLSAFGSHLLAPFEVRPLKRARVVWLNEGWFLRAGLDVLDRDIHHDICSALLREYAVSSDPRDPVDTNAARQVLFADRYGGSTGIPHGGSGRCGTSKFFNAKGIGRTPLAPDNVDWDHSHGYLWFDEAIREAISAEIAGAELPYGAIPVIAIIDTGVVFSRGDGSPPRRRAIVVRPNFLRPAHFERSVYFGAAGTPDSAQYIDVLRVRQLIEAMSGGNGKVAGFKSLRDMFLRFARQIGAARAHRLWQGRFLSSNAAVDGALVDFGSFRSVANWRAAQGLPGESFGQETAHLRAAAESLCFYFRKYQPSHREIADPKALLAEMENVINETFLQSCVRALGVSTTASPRVADNLQELIWNYYRRQQRERVKVDDPYDLRRPWIYGLIRQQGNAETLRRQADCQEALALALYLLDGCASGKRSGMTLSAAQRWFRPRHHLLYNIASRGARTCSSRITGSSDVDVSNISRYIDLQISRSRRHWPLVPAHLEICGQVTQGYSAALYCRNVETGDYRLWLEGVVAGDRLHVFGSQLDFAAAKVSPRTTAHAAGLEVDIASLSEGESATAVIGGIAIRVPAARIQYS